MVIKKFAFSVEFQPFTYAQAEAFCKQKGAKLAKINQQESKGAPLNYPAGARIGPYLS